ncbi:MAG: hypothetical protein NTU47_14920 [Ignavibacteriales bacterium]|nr:hypothetical protein [Ignavibacteriales bacterium]
MSQKTEPTGAGPATELSNTYLVSLVVASACVLVLVFAGSRLLPNPLAAFHIEGAGPVPLLYPWILAGGQTIANGLTEFSGSSLAQAGNSIFITSLLGILFSGVLVPTLTLLLMGRHRSAAGRGLYLACLIVSVTLAVTVPLTGYVAYTVRLSLREAQAVQTNRDYVINELNTIAWKLREYRIVPKALGGGEGAVDGYVLPPSLAETEDATYVIRQPSHESNGYMGPLMATLRASSKKYPGCEVEVSVGTRGQLGLWSYTGKFQ